jgi:hypothetical protein
VFDQRRQRAIGGQLGMRLADRLAQHGVPLAHADAEALHGDAGLNDTEPWAVAHELRRDRRKFHESVTATARQIIERLVDFVIGIDPYARCAMLGD